MYVDDLTVLRIETAHPDIIEELYCIYTWICKNVNSKYCRVRFTDVHRSELEQNDLYEQGRTKKGPVVTWAKGGDSYHNYGLAVDIALIIDEDKNGTFETASWDTVFDGDNDGIADWLECVKIFNQYGWQWGLINSKGKRYDLPHFQKTFGYKTSELKKLKRDESGFPILNNPETKFT